MNRSSGFFLTTVFLISSTNAFAGIGLRGEYYNNDSLLGTPTLVRTDPTVNFDWDDASPGAGISHNYFSARWTGKIAAPATGSYKFATTSDSGIKLWVNNVLIVNDWALHSTRKRTSDPVALSAGQTYDIRIDFRENSGNATARLHWTLPGRPEAIVPQSALDSTPLTSKSIAPVYLSNLHPTFQVNGWGAYQRDRSNGERGSNDGRRIAINEVDFSKGLGVHARSELRYNLAGKYELFRSFVGVDDEVGMRGSVVFQVWLDGVKAFESPLMRGTDPARLVELPTTGKLELKLIVLDGGNGIGSDHADWADAQVIDSDSTNNPLPPAAPANLTAAPGDTKVLLAWNPVQGAASYKLYRSTTAGSTSPATVAGDIATTTYTNSGLTNGTKYYFWVAAVNVVGTGAKSNQAEAMPTGVVVPPPPAPTGLTAVPGDKTIKLAWSTSTGATGYHVYRGTTAGGESATPIASNVAANTFTDQGLTNGVPYFYKVRAVGMGSMSAPSNEASATPAGLPPPPPPTGLSATAGDKSVKLAWTASTGAASYNVYRGTATGAQNPTPVAMNVASPAYTDTGLTNGVKYFYKVAAVNANGTGDKSNEASATPAAIPVGPPPPTGISATAGNGQVALKWTAATGAASYNLFRSTTSNGQGTTPVATGITGTAYTDTGLTNGTKYFYKLASVDAAGTGALSGEVSATPALTIPPVPTGLSATAGNAQVVLNWTASVGAASYNVYRGTTTTSTLPTLTGTTPIATNVTSPTFTDTGLTNGTIYVYAVAAVNAAGPSALTSRVTATPAAPAIVLTAAQKDAFRFLRQSTFGPNMTLVNRVVQLGKSPFIDEQIAAPQSEYPQALEDMPNMELVSERFFQNAILGQDQLRQRVAWALSQIFVVSSVKVDNTHAMVPYIRMLHARAFGNMKDIMRDMALSPAMGEFLDMINNQKTINGQLPNENFAREWMQLFSLGLAELNDDGSAQTGPNGPLPSYTQNDVLELSRVLTGWTYGDTIAGDPTGRNSPFYRGPMEPVASRHDALAKTVLGQPFAAGQSARADFEQALTLIFGHHNVGPFLCRHLIQKLVSSNPTPGYISACTAAFNNNGQNVRGDMTAVIKAILLNSEASVSNNTAGKFSEPAIFLSNVARALNAQVVDHPFMTDFSQDMAQRIWFAPSVFNYFSPNYRSGTLFAPEMQIWSTATAMTRTNFLASLLSNGFGTDVTLDLAPFNAVAGNPTVLVDTVDALLMGNTMPPGMKTVILTALNSATTNTERVRTALYLAASSMYYQVEH